MSMRNVDPGSSAVPYKASTRRPSGETTVRSSISSLRFVLKSLATAANASPKAVPRGGAPHILRANDALRAGLPRLHPVAGEPAQGVPVYVIDPNGFVVLRYTPGFDPAGLRADLSKLLKLM